MADSYPTRIPTLRLSNGNSIPVLGFGTGSIWFKEGNVTLPKRGDLDLKLIAAVETAISKGFHHIDCANMYGNETEVGRAIVNSGIPRSKLFVTSKLGWEPDVGDVKCVIDDTLARLQLDYLDLLLIHNPYVHSESQLQRIWKAMETEVVASKRVKSIGLSNAQQNHVEAILKIATVLPAVNQIEFHPYLQRRAYQPWLQQQKGIAVASFLGLAPLHRVKDGPLTAVLQEMAERYNTSAETILLTWHLSSQKVVSITTASSGSRMDKYLECLDLDIKDEDLAVISHIGKSYHFRAWGVKDGWVDSNDRN